MNKKSITEVIIEIPSPNGYSICSYKRFDHLYIALIYVSAITDGW